MPRFTMQIAVPSQQPPGGTVFDNQNVVPDQVSPVVASQATEYLQEQVSALEDEKVK